MSELSEGIRDRMRAALPPALKTRDKTAVAALRSALASIENAEAVATPESPIPVISEGAIAGASAGLGSADVPRRVLSETQVADIVRQEILDRRGAADAYEQTGHNEHARRLRDEADVLAGFLAN